MKKESLGREVFAAADPGSLSESRCEQSLGPELRFALREGLRHAQHASADEQVAAVAAWHVRARLTFFILTTVCDATGLRASFLNSAHLR